MIKHKNTLNLPKTKFPMKANLINMETKILLRWYKDDIYKIIRFAKNGKKKFLIHDGPPYANGNIHIGHGLNKVLKDIILKSKSLSGFDAPFVPGWDCHGLPIEHKVEKNFLKNNKKIDSSNFRNECRKYVLKQIKKQKEDFIRLGILGDWNNPYLTMNYQSEANIVRSLSKIINQGYLYKGTKPVHWCFNCRSSLAEAEVEYYNKESISIDIAFKTLDNAFISLIFNTNKLKFPIFLIVWTTMPWTIPANRAIALNPNLYYQLIFAKNKYFIIAEKLVKKVMHRINIIDWKEISIVKGEKLEKIYFNHPILEKQVPVIMSEHVNIESGTGAVHIAPGHGPDDYILAKKFNLEIHNLINSYGLFENKLYPKFNGLNINETNNVIIQYLKDKNYFIYVKKIKHSYPYCWRHKTPVIFRTTPQWFISMEKNSLRSKALKIIKNVEWYPDWGIKRIKSMLINRPDWCISRQRSWGVPITLFTHKKTGKLHPNTIEIIEKAAKQIEKNGIQSWWDLDKSFFLENDSNDYNKVIDTLDVWFDSGSIHDSIMNTHPDFYEQYCADLYIEGSDQHRGWFMSSLIISTAIRNQAPYKKVLTHGFAVDTHGKKMSKSLINTVNPKDVVDKIGADVFRIWISSIDYKNEIIVSHEVFKNSKEIYRKIRNTIRFLLANLNDFNPEIDLIKKENMISIDKWAINKTKKTQDAIINAYNNYYFHEVIQIIIGFCSIEMGSFYLEIIKDRQYTNKTKSLSRCSCQTTLWYIVEALVRWIAPIMSFTADEVWNYLPGKRSKYVFTEEWFDQLFLFDKTEKMNDNFWLLMRNIKNEVNLIIEKARKEKIIGNSLESDILLYVNKDILNQLKTLKQELKYMLLVSNVHLLEYEYELAHKNIKKSLINGLKIELKKSKGKKCLRCWHYVHIEDFSNTKNICNRCIDNILGHGEIRYFL